MAGAGIGQAESGGVILNSQHGLRSSRQVKDALPRETLQTTGRTTRILNRPKRVCVDHQPARPVPRTDARRECALPAEPRALKLAFSRHDGIFRSDVVSRQNQHQHQQNLRAGCRLPLAGPRAPVKERDGRSALCPSSAMSSDRLILDRVARQHCPSPLHRYSQTNMHSYTAQGKGDVSTLPGWGHFYFALTPRAVYCR